MKKDMYAWGKWWVPVYATQVDYKEAEQQATWCGGSCMKHDGQVRVYVPTPRGIEFAWNTYWIIQVQNLFYVLDADEFDKSFIKWDARSGGNTDLQEWPSTPTQTSEKKRVKEDHGHVIRNPKVGR